MNLVHAALFHAQSAFDVADPSPDCDGGHVHSEAAPAHIFFCVKGLVKAECVLA
jgi:hypothetical protein